MKQHKNDVADAAENYPGCSSRLAGLRIFWSASATQIINALHGCLAKGAPDSWRVDPDASRTGRKGSLLGCQDRLSRRLIKVATICLLLEAGQFETLL